VPIAARQLPHAGCTGVHPDKVADDHG
jgi:hypothetical protein